MITRMERLHQVLLLLSLCCTLVCVEALTEAELLLFTARVYNESNTNLQGVVSVDSTGADRYTIASNGIPDHETGKFPGTGNPNNLKEQTFKFRIPKSPTQASTTSCLTFGPVAVARNGVPLFNPNNIDGNNAVEGKYAEVFDSCQGHPDVMGIYHYHQTPDCLYTGANDEFIGVALDGFPIYGIKDSTGQELTSADLDTCHGHEYNGGYRYRLTRDYPYIMGCYKGTRMDQGGSTPPDDCLGSSSYQLLPSVLLVSLTSLVLHCFL